MKKIFKNLNSIWNRFKKTGDELWDQMEEELVAGDVSINTAGRIINSLRDRAYKENINGLEDIRKILKQEIMDILDAGSSTSLSVPPEPPAVYMVVGVNGVGKTSAIAKLANMFNKQGSKVMLAAADTYRAAAVEQLGHFADMLGIDMINHQRNADPGAVVYDTLASAIARNADIVIIDTAGRMQTSYNLMQELKKIKKVVNKKLGRFPDEVLLAIDATTGQNARSQAQIFSGSMDVTGIILTKTDGTSRGGIVLTIKNDLDIPVKIITKGEKIDDIEYFDPEAFTENMVL
jgi:fused signal recognition particle receptor